MANNNLNCIGPLPTSFDSGAVTVNSTSVWTNVANLQLPGNQSAVIIRVEVGAGGALGGLKLTRAAAAGHTHIDWLVATATSDAIRGSAGWQDVLRVLVNGVDNFGTAPANSAAEIHLIRTAGIAEIGVWALKASTDTTLKAYGSVAN